MNFPHFLSCLLNGEQEACSRATLMSQSSSDLLVKGWQAQEQMPLWRVPQKNVRNG